MNAVQSRPRLVLAILLVVAAAFAAVPASQRLEIDNRLERWTVDDAVGAEDYRRFRELFGSDEFLLVAVAGPDLFEASSLDRLLVAAEACEQVDGVVRVRGLPLVYRDLYGAEDPEALRMEAASPLYEGLLVNADGTMMGLLLDVDPPATAVARRQIVAAVQRAVEPLEHAGMTAHLVGSTALSAALDEVSAGEARRVFPLALIGSLLVLVVLLRSPRALAVALVCAGLAVVLTLGLVAVSGRPLNMVTTSLAPLLWVLALANIVHLLNRYQQLAVARPAAAALAGALDDTTGGLVLAAMTTAAGFGSLLAAPMVPVRELGVMAAGGILVSLLVNLTVGPVLIELLRVPGRETAVASDRWLVGMRRPSLVVVVTALAAVVAVAVLPGLKLHSDPLTFLPADHQLVCDYQLVGERLSGFYTLEVIVEPPSAWYAPQQVEVIDQLARQLAASPVVATVVSPLDLLRQAQRWRSGFTDLEWRLPSTVEEAEAVMGWLGDDASRVLRTHVTDDGAHVRLSVVVNDMDELRFLELVHRAREAVSGLPGGYHGWVTGQVLQLVNAQQRLLRAQMWSLGTALLLVFLVLGVGLRSVQLTVLAMLPNALPMLATFAAMAVLGLALDPATVMVASVALGVAVDNTAHMLAALRYHRRSSGPAEAVATAVRQVGPAMVVTACTAAVGFAALGASQFVPIRHFGELAALATGVALAGDILLLPALVTLVWSNTTCDVNPD